ncbi:hypothetical protein [Levilactobacillus angrenensis]|uniref:Uncharacterized protein n=1 Tax=Levilactobacillus angrenensis TaxID=2486020 RepID=A0ABW1U615_9LACO|nr:hypothetical protein [Levilactobacillus angrenensis]
MIRLWQLSDDGDIVEFKSQVEDEEQTEIVMYSRSRAAIKFNSRLIDEYAKMYHSQLRFALFKMGKADEFPKQYTIAWF